MAKYTPFLKLKTNEIAALAALTSEIKNLIVPFFDLAKKPLMTSDSFKRMVTKAVVAVDRHLDALPAFYIDNFDIEDDMSVDGEDNYLFVMEAFRKLPFIPVVGLDRAVGRNQIVFDAKKNGILNSNAIAIRLQAEDFVSFALIQDDLEGLFESGNGLFDQWILILDNRVCLNVDVSARVTELESFIASFSKMFAFAEIIVAGSSIPASIGDLVKVQTELHHERIEMAIHTSTCAALADNSFGFGDYTVVSPLYSDVDIPPAVMLNVMAPRVVYSYEDLHFFARGGALRSHPRANAQYNDIAKYLIAKPFFRRAAYSFGDKFLEDKANMIGSMVTPGSILKPTINAHISYMSRIYGLV